MVFAAPHVGVRRDLERREGWPKCELRGTAREPDGKVVQTSEAEFSGWQESWVLETPPRFVLPLAGPYGALLLGAIAFLAMV